MAKSIFAFDTPSAASPKQADPKAYFEGLAGRHQVPTNVIIALAEAEGAGVDADRLAADVGTQIRAGKAIEQVIAERAGDAQRSAAILSRAYDIADVLYPRAQEPAKTGGVGTAVKDVAATGLGALVRGGAMLSRGAGELASGAVDTANRVLVEPALSAITQRPVDIPQAPNLTEAIGVTGVLDRLAEGADSLVSPEAEKDKAEFFSPTADLFQPSTWSLGRPTVRGAVLNMVEAVGSMAPVVAASLFSGGGAAAAVGGLQSAGDGSQTAGQAVDQMWAETTPDGRRRIESESKVYRDLVASGMPPEQAYQTTKRRAEQMGAAFQAIPGILGGAATSKILQGTSEAVRALSTGKRVAATAALSGAEEGAQEVIEGIGGRAGLNLGAGTNESLTEGSLTNAIQGAMGGAPVGAVAGLVNGAQQPALGAAPPPDPQLALPAPPRALPPPPLGLPAPALGLPAPPRALPPPNDTAAPPAAPTQPGPDGSGAGPVAAPDATPMADGAAAPIPPALGAQPPTGPLAGIAALAPPPVQPAPLPPVMFPDMKPGTAVEILGPSGPLQATFLRETPEGVVLRVDGQEVSLSGQVFDRARQAAINAKETAKPAPKPGGLAAKAAAQVTDAAGPREVLTPSMAAQIASNIRTQARETGWQPNMRARYKALAEVARKGGIPVESLVDEEVPAPPPAPKPKPAAKVGTTPAVSQPDTTGQEAAMSTTAAMPTVTPIREKAAVLRGIPEDQPPAIPGVSLKWDAKEKGFVFARKHTYKVRDALGLPVDRSPVGEDTPVSNPTPPEASKPAEAPQGAGPRVMVNRIGRDGLTDAERKAGKTPLDYATPEERIARRNEVAPWSLPANATKTTLTEDEAAALGAHHFRQGYKRIPPVSIRDRGEFAARAWYRGWDKANADEPLPKDAPEAPAQAEQAAASAVPTAAEIKAEAAKADPSPTDGQKEAGNYQMGHIHWNGLDITIETAKGALRKGKDADGEEWSVKMPAHYGYIKRTTGADGDHLDVYIGPNPESDVVVVIDQVDAETGEFDEHKVIIGTANSLEAAKLYAAGFSDGKGEARMGAATMMAVEQFKSFVKHSSWTMPTSLHGKRGENEPQAWHAGFADRFRKKPREVPSYFTQNKRSNGYQRYLAGWDAADKEPMVPKMPGREGTPGVLVVKSLQTGKETTVDTRPSQPAPKVGTTPALSQRDTSSAKAIIDAGMEVADGLTQPGDADVAPSTDLMGKFEHTQLAARLAKVTGLEARAKIADQWVVEMGKAAGVEYLAMLDKDGVPIGLTSGIIQPDGGHFVGMTQATIRALARGQVAYATHNHPKGTGLSAGDLSNFGSGLRRMVAIASDGSGERHEATIPDVGNSYPRGTSYAGIFEALNAVSAVFKNGIGQENFNQHRDGVRAHKLFASAFNLALHRLGVIRYDGTALELLRKEGKSLEDVDKYLDAVSQRLRRAGFTIAQERVAIGNRPGEGDASADGVRPQEQGRDAAGSGTVAGSSDGDGRVPVTPAAKPAAGILGVLSQEKQDRAAELKARLAAKARNQLNSGLDPEYITLGGELVALYIEAGTKRFAQMLRDFAETTGLSLREAQAPMRAAYNHVRDEMDLNGEDISGMDTSDQVMAEVRRAIAAEATAKPSQKRADDATLDPAPTAEVSSNGQPDRASSGEVGEGGKPRPDAERGTDGLPAGDATSGSLANRPTRPRKGDAAGGGSSSSGARSGRQDRDPDAGEPARRDEPVGGADGSVAGSGNAGSDRERPASSGRSNYHIKDPELLFGGGPKARFARNQQAIEAFQLITDQAREPTPEELDAMASFTGWGSFGQELFQGSWAYPRPKDGWANEDKWLRDYLGQEGWQSAQNSIINAHYTDPPTVQAMWDAIRAMGFKGGRILEPSMGIGNFFGMMPRDIEANSELSGIELEATTGGMAKLLYPRANIRVMGYEKSRVPDNFYDLVIGNWPFANVKIADRRYDRLKPSLHDYFFLKALDQVRPGGLVVGITSAFSMDGQKNKALRAHLARNAELVGAYRLPTGAFEKYAGTKVVTDIIILKKRAEPFADGAQAPWVSSELWKSPSGQEVTVNSYFLQNPGKVLGTLDTGSGTTYGQAGMIVRRPDDLADRLAAIAKDMSPDTYTTAKRGKEPRFVDNTTTDRIFSVIIGKDGGLYHVTGDKMSPLVDVIKIAGKTEAEKQERLAQIKSLVELRRAAEDVMAADRDGSTEAEALRKQLKDLYTRFTKAHGKIGASFGLKVMEKLRDPNAGLVAALETQDGKPSALMSAPTVRAARKLDKPTIRDAFVLARNESVTLDIDRIAELAKASPDAVIADLLASGAIYRTPGGGYQASDVYLSGNVRQKLREAKDALADGEDMQASVDALAEVVPEDIPYFLIEARFGADWLPADVNRQFILETLGVKDASAQDVELARGASGWSVKISDRLARMGGIPDITGAPLPGERGTGLSLRRFLEATLNTQTITVTAMDRDGTFKDTKATETANQKAADLRMKFSSWVWGDPERRVLVEREYNEAMNAVATPKVDGQFLEFPGMALARRDRPFNLRKHQADAIWKGLLNQRGIYGHEVGTGKTITMTGIAVESRRYGLAKKPLLIAHNANSAAVAAEAQATYPGAKILYVNNLAPDEINAQLRRMATEDWDLIVIPHSLLDRMALSEKTLKEMAADDIAAYEREAILASEEGDGGVLRIEDLDNPEALKKLRLPLTAKEMVKARQRLIQAIEKQAARASRDGAVKFEDLGVDMILVDESHEFKKPPLTTRMQVKGLNTGTSDKSLALKFLTSYVKRQRGGTGVHVFTGTPITNTLPEIYHQMYYAMDDVMRQAGVDTWDGFFKTFADSIADVEFTSTGDYENVERLASFINVSELRRLAGQYLDIVFAKDMPEFLPRATPSGKTIKDPTLTAEERDFLENGRQENPVGRPYKKVVHDLAPMGADQKRILDEVTGYARAFKAASGKQRREIMQRGGPDAPIVYNNVPNRASMDARLHEPDAEDHPQSKANRAVRRVAQIYRDEPKAAQVIFMDEGYSDETTSTKTLEDGSKVTTKKRKFNLAKDIVAKLVAEGVKPEEIRIVAGGVKPEEKAAIADGMNTGKIRVVIGQTKTLGVGVNMQVYLRAMHHLDAPWMPGDLEQRNGRGERQGNTWNTVYEYRYLTEGLDPRRWQVLAVKDRFIKAFLQAKDGLRVIDGEAADDAESLDGASLADTLAEAAGDPRLMTVTKLRKTIEKLQNRERIHTSGIADAIARARRLRAQIASVEEELPARRNDAAYVTELRAAGTFSATIDGKTYTERPEATEAIAAFLAEQAARLPKGGSVVLNAEVNGFGLRLDKPSWAFKVEDVNLSILRRSEGRVGTLTLGSIEAAIRRIVTDLQKTDESIADFKEQIARLDRAKDEPFQQAAELAKKIAQKKAIEDDLAANPVAPPSWLRVGAPMESVIFVDGQERVVTGHRWTQEGWFVTTDEGDVPYMEAKDAAGMALYEERPFTAPEVLEGSKLKDGSKPPVDDDADPEDKESRFGAPEPVSAGDLRDMADRVAAELDASGLAGRITARVVRGLLGASGIPIMGRQSGRLIEVAAGPDALGVMRHEIIHALRDSSLWDAPFGLFTRQEWTALVAAARADKALMARVREAYPDLSAAGQIEEAVAEMYRGYAEARDSDSAVVSAMRKIGAFLGAVVNALRGKGYVSAAQVMERVRAGDVGGRGPDGPPRDGKGRFVSPSAQEKGVGSEMRQGLLDRIKAIWNGARPDVPVAISRLPEVFRALTSRDNVLVMSASVIRKAGSHGLTLNDIANALDGLEDPVMVFDSTNETGNLTALVETAAEDGRPLVVVVDTSFRQGKVEVSRVATIHGKDKADAILQWMRNGYLRYLNKQKAGAWSRSIGRQLPKDMEISHRLGQKILQHRDVFKADDPAATKATDGDAATREMRAALLTGKFKDMVSSRGWNRKPGDIISTFITDSMAGKAGWNTLALVPGRALFTELGRRLPSARAYQATKEAMDALRNDWHGRSDTVAQAWRDLRNKDPRANDAMMDLMHRSTLTGIDPSKPDTWRHAMHAQALREVSQRGERAAAWAKDVLRQVEKHEQAYARMKEMFDALPKPFQAMYGRVRDEYTAIADDFDKAIVDNIRVAGRLAMRRAEREHRQELARIRDEGLTGKERDDAKAAADEALERARARGGAALNARIQSLRQVFESNRLKGPYFPLARFGDFFVTVRDEDGKVISFSRFEKRWQQEQEIARQEKANPGRVSHGVLSKTDGGLRDQVDPTFVADVERLLSDSGASPEVMDQVWQRYLETLPDQSIRTAKIHRKGREGFNADAFRAFGKHMFHGAHQLARLKYGLILEEHLENATEEARLADSPERAGLVVNEMRARHAFTMNPVGGPVPAALSSLAFVWYLGLSPAAALANLSQTTIVGIPILGAAFPKAGVAGATKEVGKALADLVKAKWNMQQSTDLTEDEKAALAKAYEMGAIDKTQAHDLAAVADTGIEYNAAREKVMRYVSWFFHISERGNREVTFLAAFRLAKAAGMPQASAVAAASDATWKSHFDYQGSARPRVMQSDLGKILTTFRNFTVNMLWRLFRDAHQSFHGDTEEVRREARTQLIGITLSMMAHAGIRGTWGYGLLMMLLGLFLPGGGDDYEEWLQDALLMEGDDPGTAAWNWIMGAALQGIPGQVTGISLTDRIGMPNLWFRGQDKDMEGQDLFAAHVGEFLGPIYGIGAGFYRSFDLLAEGEVQRAIEAPVPKFIRDPLTAFRWATEGVETIKGDPILEDVGVREALAKAIGFTPANVAERYQINTRLKNEELRLVARRSDIQREVAQAMREGQAITPAMIEAIRTWNMEYPEYPITPDTIRQSLQAQIRASNRNEFGLQLNPKLNDRLRAEQPPMIYN